MRSGRVISSAGWLRLCAGLVCLLGLLRVPVYGQVAGTANHAAGTANRVAKQEAISALPLRSITPQTAARIRSIVTKPTIYRRLPASSIAADPELFLFLIRNPEVVVGIWQNMGITELGLQRTGPYSFDSTDGMGTSSHIELVYGTPGLHMFHGSGLYEGPLLHRRIRGECVMLLRSNFVRGPDGQPIVQNMMDVFVKLERGAVDIAAKTLHPLFIHTADTNFVETSKFVDRLAEAIVRNGSNLQRVADRLDNVDPDVKTELVDIATRLNHRSVTGGAPVIAGQSGSSAASRATRRSGVVPTGSVSRFPPDAPLRR